jgi:Na+-transporting NADH:ubiquinone oxidoreductase subunit C
MPSSTLEKGALAVSASVPKKAMSNTYTIFFMIVLSFACALILSILASVLEKPKEVAKELDRSKQMMIAAKLLDHQDYFLVQDPQGNYLSANYEEGRLVPSNSSQMATKSQLLDIYSKRIIPFLVDKEGNIKTFEEEKINYNDYLAAYRKTGYYQLPLMLVYKILPNPADKESNINSAVEGYVIPINGLGLWDAIYGYLAIKPDGNTVIGISWYDQKETPGLGANISEAYWQSLFPNKQIFQQNADGKTDFKSAPLGLTVVKGKVAESLGTIPKAKSAVDGMAGATLTGNGVTDAYRNVLAPYRPFLTKLHQTYSLSQEKMHN